MAHPLRLQRSRRKGYRTPEGAVYVGRPTLWGNPFQAKRFGHAKAVKLHRQWLDGQIAALTLENLGFCPKEIESLYRWRTRLMLRLHELDGRTLQCWCPLSSPCHADTLAERATIHADYERFAA